MVAMASSFSASVASALNSRIAARASVKRQLGALVGFLLQRAVDHRQHGLVMGLEHRLRGLDALGGIRRQQRQAPERGLDGAAQPVVEAHRGGAVRNAGDRRTGRGIDDLAVGLGDVNFLGLGIGHQPAVLQRADDRKSQRIAAGRDRAHGLVGIGEFIVCELADRVLERPRHHRQRHRENQQKSKGERA